MEPGGRTIIIRRGLAKPSRSDLCVMSARSGPLGPWASTEFCSPRFTMVKGFDSRGALQELGAAQCGNVTVTSTIPTPGGHRRSEPTREGTRGLLVWRNAEKDW